MEPPTGSKLTRLPPSGSGLRAPLPFVTPVLIVKGFTKVGNFTSGRRSGEMRMTSMVAGLALALAACGGEKKADNQQTTTTPEQQPAQAAPAPAGNAKTHD